MVKNTYNKMGYLQTNTFKKNRIDSSDNKSDNSHNKTFLLLAKQKLKRQILLPLLNQDNNKT